MQQNYLDMEQGTRCMTEELAASLAGLHQRRVYAQALQPQDQQPRPPNAGPLSAEGSLFANPVFGTAADFGRQTETTTPPLPSVAGRPRPAAGGLVPWIASFNNPLAGLCPLTSSSNDSTGLDAAAAVVSNATHESAAPPKAAKDAVGPDDLDGGAMPWDQLSRFEGDAMAATAAPHKLDPAELTTLSPKSSTCPASVPLPHSASSRGEGSSGRSGGRGGGSPGDGERRRAVEQRAPRHVSERLGRKKWE